MVLPSYAFVEDIEPGPTKSALESVWDELTRLDDAVVALGTPLTLAGIQAALQQGGSNELNVNGLVGKLLQPQPCAARAWALWYQSSASVAGAGEFQWDVQVQHTAPEQFTRRNTTEIHFRDAGAYLLLANLETSSATTHSLELNGVRIAAATSASHSSLGVVRNVAQGARLTALNAAGNRVGNADGRTNLAVVRLS